MSRFHPLKVTNIEKTTRDAVIVTLKPDDDALFEFLPGQYLTFRRSFGETELRRSYSICAGADDGVLQVAIKKVGDGAFSSWANDEMVVGDVLDAMPPMGKFHIEVDAEARRHYLGFAGGSGITPVLSILKTVLAREPHSRFTLVYANRGLNTIMFREQLEDLKNLFLGRLSMVHILETDAQDIDLFTGRVDKEKCAGLFEHWIDIKSVDTALICGPEPMMEAVANLAIDRNVACQVSLETPMACGIGICFTCVAKICDENEEWDFKRTCVEGPVFNARSVCWD